MATKAKKPTASSQKKMRQTATKSTTNSQNNARVRKLSWKLKRKVDKKVKRSEPIPAAPKLFWRSLKHLWRYKKLFLGILLIYGVLNFLLVKGIAGNFQLGGFKDTLQETFGNDLNTWATAVSMFGLLVGSTGSTSGEAGSVYQVVLLFITSLALIWALRHTYEKPVKIRIRDAFYKGMYPLVPLLLVLLVVMLQFIPLLIGSSLYSVALNGGVAVSPVEKIAWTAVLIISAAATVYMLSASVFALYIVTLPDMTPMRALRAARKMVKFRRWIIIRKVIFLPFVLMLSSALLLIPLIIILPVLAEIVYMAGAIITIAVVHSYGYALYRELL